MTGAAPADPVLVAVDFSGGRLRLHLAEVDGRRVRAEEWPFTEPLDEEAWSREVGGRIAALFAREGERRSALAIAVACPGSVDPVAGRLLESSDHEEWDGLSVVDAIRRHIDVPVVAVARAAAALVAEAGRLAPEASDLLYVSLRDAPIAAVRAAGRSVLGASHRAGALPALPRIDPDDPGFDDAIETATGILADAVALLDPEMVVLDAPDAVAQRLGPLLQRVIDEVAPGPAVVPAALGESAALVGALQAAATVAFEGERQA